MKLSSKILISLAGPLAALMTGCADDIVYNPAEETQREGIYLRIPDMDAQGASTRSLDGGAISTVAQESKLTDLWLYVFNEDGTYRKMPTDILSNFESIEMHDQAGNQYKEYKLPDDFFAEDEANKKFQIYLVANLSDYTANDDWKTKQMSASELEGTILNFRDNETLYRLSASNVIDKGLPMACLNSEVQITTNGTTVTGGGLTIKPGTSATIHVDMKYLCSKVRYTILFDNTDGTMSKTVFGNKSLTLTSASAEDLNGESQKVGTDKAENSSDFFNLASIELNKVEYPGNPTAYPVSNYDGTDQRYENLSTVTTQSNDKRAWQGTVYLPVNPGTSKTTGLIFKGTVEGGADVSYYIPLVPNPAAESSASTNPLEAGKYYDIVAKAKGLQDIVLNKVDVKKWSRTQMLYTLTQNLFLEVNPTIIEKVEGGQEYAIAYNSSAAVKFFGPSYEYEDGGEKKSIDIFSFEQRNDTAFVSVNPALESAWFTDISHNPKYSWIEAQAGDGILNKKIQINNLILYRFLTVTPNRMFINVNELTSSGYYSNPETSTFEVETNVNEFWIEVREWPSGANLNDASKHIWIEFEDETDDSKKIVPFTANAAAASLRAKIDNKDGIRKFKLRYEGLNDGLNIWSTTQTLRLSVRVDNTGYDGENYVNPVDFQVEIASDKDNYVIHFKAKNNIFTDNYDSKYIPPHVYIYQCLELPSTFHDTKDGIDLTSYPVGVGTGNAWAALEYCFTGKIAFRGWDWDLNAESLRNKDYEGWSDGNNFICFKGDWDQTTNKDNRYNNSMDFFEAYRLDVSRCVCSYCRDAYNYNKGFPGIVMEEEGDGWYKIELTGIATPGRTLFMWKKGHNSSDNQAQHPGKDQPGIRLFDFPSKEAWYYYEEGNEKANKWFSTKAAADAVAGGSTNEEFKFNESNGWIYFSNPDNWTKVCIHYWKSNGGSSWPGMEMTKMNVGGKVVWGYEIPTDMEYIIFNNGSNNAQTGDLKIDQTTNYYNKTGRAGDPLGQ